MTHTIHFLSAEIKDVPVILCDTQLAAIESVHAIFSNWRTVEAYIIVPPTAVTNQPKTTVPLPNPSPIQYPAPTFKGVHSKDRVVTSKGVLKGQTPLTPKDGEVPVNFKGTRNQ